MTFDADLKAHIGGDAAIAALIVERFTPQPVPQGSLMPAMTYVIVTEEPQTDLDGEDGALLEVHAQLDCWASSQDVVRQLAELVRLRMKSSSFSATPVPGSAFADYEQQTKRHRFTRTFQCWYQTS